MHTLHWFAVEAEDVNEAFYSVKDRLINEDGSNFVEWSDWHVVGGGRWSDTTYDDSTDMIIHYATSPEKFKEAIQDCKKARIHEMNNCIEKINTDKFVSDMVDFVSNNAMPLDEERFSMNSYYINTASDLLRDMYTSNSYFYDMVEYTAHFGYIEQRLDNADISMRQFLVPVDFHF